jgi:hypothetical protein
MQTTLLPSVTGAAESGLPFPVLSENSAYGSRPVPLGAT